jgi:hypothetical protein
MQKNAITLYHMGVYTRNDIQDWFMNEYPKYTKHKLDRVYDKFPSTFSKTKQRGCKCQYIYLIRDWH